MRNLFGWFCVLFMVPVFLLCGLAAGKESEAIKGLGTVLDEKIPIDSMKLAQNSYIFDRDGRLISEMTSLQQNRIFTKYEDIPDLVKTIYILSEDQRFFEHIGFDAEGMIRAVIINAKTQSVEQGASTITQQLARNVYLTHEQTYNRKLSELLYSYQIEKSFTKEQILEGYLNAIYFSNGTYGIGTASTYYFSKQIQELNTAQLAFISAIPNNPTMYDPIKNFDATKERQIRLLNMLHSNGVISKDELESAIDFPIKLSIKKRTDTQPDYVTYVHHELKQLISVKEGYLKGTKDGENKDTIENQIDEKVNQIVSNGIIIHTALDTNLQHKLTESISKHLPFDEVQGAAAVIDHQAHTIIALSGGKKYEKFDFNRAYQAYRHPGSAIKPLLDYAPYIDLTGATANSKIDASEFCKNGYCPKNYSERNYGMVTLETALKYSYNTAAVRMLDSIGIEKGFSYLTPFQFSKVTKEDYKLPAAIGGFDYGVSPLELTNAYTTFANNGLYYKNHAITKITDLNGKTLYQWNEEPVRVWKESTNNQMKDLLASVVKSGTGQKANVSSSYVGGKTGTSNEYKDLWFAGLTDKYTAAVWVGKDEQGNVSSIYSNGPQMLIWKEIMK
ncbi:penicillin-binding protein 1A [Metabacillus crassostreae]|uniref:transglycosylase domain-containing protein n=1 Tax=Metabacillus crassostreae TaxID=929098 RepID=UPI001957A690|nr:transglycosylase domain-containing protein [Metabacillus crassostreae]MBM7605450.1 penicillin-binding protein 1A [Metabacillus crassostreae]